MVCAVVLAGEGRDFCLFVAGFVQRSLERLRFFVLLLSYVLVAGAETVDNEDVPFTEPKPFNPRESIAKVTQVNAC